MFATVASCNKSNQVDKIHFLSCVSCIFEKVSKILNWLLLTTKTEFSQNGHFDQQKTFSILWEIKYLV